MSQYRPSLVIYAQVWRPKLCVCVCVCSNTRNSCPGRFVNWDRNTIQVTKNDSKYKYSPISGVALYLLVLRWCPLSTSGNSAQFTVTASGPEPPDILWYRDEIEVRRLVGETTKTSKAQSTTKCLNRKHFTIYNTGRGGKRGELA